MAEVFPRTFSVTYNKGKRKKEKNLADKGEASVQNATKTNRGKKSGEKNPSS